MGQKLKITKIEAARAQLKTAIELWFHDGDPVSIHTLACASHQIINDINAITADGNLIFDSTVINDNKRKDWIKRIKADCNFFKHANNDATNIIEFDINTSEFYFMFSLKGLMNIGVVGNVAETAYFKWFMLHNPELVTELGNEHIIKSTPVDISEVKQFTRKEFFEAFCIAYARVNP